MNEISLGKFAKGMNNSPIGQRNTLPTGENYLFEKTNNNFNVIVEFESGKWTSAKETKIGFVYSSGSKIDKPIDNSCRWIALNSGFEQTTKKNVDVSVKLDFQSIPIKSVLRMKVNERGYSTLDTTPLTPKVLKSLKTVEIE